jgi:hypothetical protein
MNPVRFLKQFFKRRCGALILAGVVGYCVVYALAFVQLYKLEHPYRVASRWIFDNVPAGSRISSPHWDDKVPVGIPGGDTAIYQMNGRDFELPVYERDTPQMTGTIINRIVAADYLTFATPRAADSIPRIPDEYPNMSALLRLLWGEKLGFSLVYTTKNRPSFLGITFNDDLADESFSVYDHPKVVVFKNDERLTADQILDRIQRVKDFEPLPSMNEMLLMDKGGWAPAKRLWRSEWSLYARSLVVALVLGCCVWVLIGRVFRWLPDRGLGLSVVLGVVGAATAGWGLSVLHIVPLTRAGGGFVVLLLIVLAALKFLLRESTQRRAAQVLRLHGLGTFAAIVIGAVVVMIMRSSDSALVGLGDSVDAAYLSYLIRSQDSLPWDIFHPGQRLPLSFADRFVLGWLFKVTGTPPGFALEASFIVLGGLVAGALYSILVGLVRRARPALIGVLLVIIPAVYLLHVARDVTTRPLVPLINQNSMTRDGELIRWVQQQVLATPLVVEACDGGSPLGIAATVGLPRYVESAKEVGSSICSLDDPEQVYRRMMSSKLELFLTSSGGSASSEVARSRYERFSSRPDLFARIFDSHGVALFVPAFSRYYPRAVVS